MALVSIVHVRGLRWVFLRTSRDTTDFVLVNTGIACVYKYALVVVFAATLSSGFWLRCVMEPTHIHKDVGWASRFSPKASSHWVPLSKQPCLVEAVSGVRVLPLAMCTGIAGTTTQSSASLSGWYHGSSTHVWLSIEEAAQHTLA